MLPTLVISVLLVAVLAFGEFTARVVEHSHPVFDATHHLHGHVVAYARSFALPNYWIWYDPDAVWLALEAQQGGELEFLVHLIYNCACATPYVATWLAFVTMFICVRTLPTNAAAARVVGWVPVVAFVFDASEDLLLLHLHLGFPESRHNEAEARVMATCSLLKFACWGLTLLSWGAMVACRLIRGAPRHEHTA